MRAGKKKAPASACHHCTFAATCKEYAALQRKFGSPRILGRCKRFATQGKEQRHEHGR